MPFGRGRWIDSGANGVTDALIGGWQLSGLARWTSGFAVNVDNGPQYPSNYQLEGNANKICSVTTGTYYTGPTSGTANTAPNLFANGITAANCFDYAFPGGTGGRNQIRGPGYFGVDLGLAKRWKMPWSDGQSLQFRWEVFNVTNSVRFDVQSAPPPLAAAWRMAIRPPLGISVGHSRRHASCSLGCVTNFNLASEAEGSGGAASGAFSHVY